MPQAKHKAPFSGKAKKQQLKEKKQRQQHKSDQLAKKSSQKYLVRSRGDDSEEEESGGAGGVLSVNKQPSTLSRWGKKNPNRYNLQFHRETDADVQARKEEARQTLTRLPEETLEIHIQDYFPPELSFPVRPLWDFSLTRDQLNAREHSYFSEYVKKIEEKFNWAELSYFELNLETWRQLWRVLEMSDIVLLIADVRFPALMLPPSLFTYIRDYLEKQIIVVLNKIDLAPSPLVLAWKHYLRERYPGIHIVMFTSFPHYNLRSISGKQGGLQVRRQRGKMRMAAEGARKLYEACKDIVNGLVDLSSWQEKISEEMLIETDINEEDVEIDETVNLKTQDTSFFSYDRYGGGVLTIGCIGQPNVGKSSLMNALMGKKVVSVSKTPGHTKHFQTIFLTKTIKLCDCPGLVFPSRVPKALQVLMGSFPIAQLRDPYTCVKFLAERLDLINMLKIEHPEQDDVWSALDICDGWAKKKGFYTARAARLDTYRAANHILRMALEGKIILCMSPPGYTSSKAKWATHPDVQVVEWIQAASSGVQQEQAERRGVASTALSDSEESEEEEEEEEDGSDAAASATRPDQSDGEPPSSDEEPHSIQSHNKFHQLNLVE